MRSIKSFFKSDKGLSFLALLPLFFIWVPILTWNSSKELVRKYCLYSCLFSMYFFAFLFFAFLFSLLPFGDYLSPHIHLLGMIVYLSLSGIFIYSVLASKTIVIKPLEKHHTVLSNFLDTSAHSSAG
ncbi:MAG: hypothetical protein AAF518_23900 [Spirochaetota bacterium]